MAQSTLRLLNVAEKPSVARSIAHILSNNQPGQRRSRAPSNPTYEFSCRVDNFQAAMTFTSILGHLMELDFPASHRAWRSCSPLELFSASVHKSVPQNKLSLKNNLEELARHAQWLVLWLDCDREGENISFEVMQVCLAANPRLVVKRARFSALVQADILRALNGLVAPDEAAARAVDARQEIDLRIGAAFTRFQTLLLQDKFDWSHSMPDDKPLLSFGPCQFPTLGLIVQRAWEIQSHMAEPFWEVRVVYRSTDGKACDFKWARGRLFDHAAAVMLYEPCVQQPSATVLQVRGQERLRWPPLPLSTLEMQKRATVELRLSGERIMRLAEELYQSGFVSYPRTETDHFDANYDLLAMIRQHTSDGRWGAHAQAMVNGAMFCQPSRGRSNDKAHPPIHPTRHTRGEQGWSQDKLRLYEFIVRSFLAACSKPALGLETVITISIAGELFSTSGLMVKERNWLDVYPYAGWSGNAEVPQLTPGQIIMPSEVLLHEGVTQAPRRLTERDLIAAMEAHGIGTDATVAEHIQKQLDRGYAMKDAGSMTFAPTALGEALVGGYRSMDLDTLWQPDLRGKIESNIDAVARGVRNKEDVLEEAIQAFRANLLEAQRSAHILEQEFASFFPRLGAERNASNAATAESIGDCQCGGSLLLRHQGERVSVNCSSQPLCKQGVVFPASLVSVSTTPQYCSACAPCVRLLQLQFRRGLIPADMDTRMTACVLCDAELQRLLSMCGRVHLRPVHAGVRGRTHDQRSRVSAARPRQHGRHGGRPSVRSEVHTRTGRRPDVRANSSHRGGRAGQRRAPSGRGATQNARRR